MNGDKYIIEYHTVLGDIILQGPEAIEGANDPQELAAKLTQKVNIYDYAIIYFMDKNRVMKRAKIRLDDYGAIPDEQGRQNYKVNLCL